MRLLILCMLLSGCASVSAYPALNSIYWDHPPTGWYWVAKGVEPAAIPLAARDCGAIVDGSVANHGMVPPGFSVQVFHFVKENTSAARECT